MKIAIIGGGVAGSSAAVYFGQLGLDVTLFEREKSLVSGPPFCHLHAGGNLYREISDEQCIKLLKQSIDFLLLFPYVVDYRPTVIVVPKTDKSTALDLLPRLELIKNEYKKLIEKDSENEVLGDSSSYYKCYNREDLELFKNYKERQKPVTLDDWMVPVAKNIDLDIVQFPIVIVGEYGLNLFRLSAGLTLSLEKLNSVTFHTNAIVKDISDSWKVHYTKDNKTYIESFDYLINAAGFRTGKIDDMLDLECKKMVEFKAAYITNWKECVDIKFPEIIFHGKRGTPQGMGQFTPYPNGNFQLHGMTENITLFEDGLVSATKQSCQPKLDQKYIDKIEKSWSEDEINDRTSNAIKHISQFIPSFSTATVASKPLYGAQQIPGDDPSLRVAEVCFAKEKYARCEIVKVSSVLDMIDAILKDLALENRDFKQIINLDENDIKDKAEKIAESRDYPKALASRNIEKQP